MDTTLIAGVIGAVATLLAAAFGLWATHRSSRGVDPGGAAEPMPIRTLPTPEAPAPEKRYFETYSGHRFSVTPECEKDLELHGLSETKLIRLVLQEFTFHTNYFRFDLEDYVLPVRDGLLVYLDKIGDRVAFKRVFSCTRDQAKLANWTDILALYRRATRLPYRKDPATLAFTPGALREAQRVHNEISRRIIKHFFVYEGMTVNPETRAAVRDAVERGELSAETIPAGHRHHLDSANEIEFHLAQSQAALREADEIHEEAGQANVITPSLLGPLVAAVERSLQHLHKIMARYPPTAEFPSGGPSSGSA